MNSLTGRTAERRNFGGKVGSWQQEEKRNRRAGSKLLEDGKTLFE